MLLHLSGIPRIWWIILVRYGDGAQRATKPGSARTQGRPVQAPQHPVLGPVSADWISPVTGAPSRPAPRPGTIHAMMPITGSLASDEIDVRVAGPARQVAVGEITPAGSCPLLGRCVFYGADRTENSGSWRLPPIFTGRSCRVRSNTFTLPRGQGSSVHARDQSAGRSRLLRGLTQP
jgi:hypothetical protein